MLQKAEEATTKEATLLDKVLTMAPTERTERVRQRYLNTKNKIVIDIARIQTRVMREAIGNLPAQRNARIFAETVRGLPINIYPDELFVGWLYTEPRGTSLDAWRAVAMEGQLDTISTRENVPFLITDEDKRELREEIIPYWKTVRFPPEPLRAAQREPEKYRDLTVKVSGYNAPFVELYRELQDSIITRTEHRL